MERVSMLGEDSDLAAIAVPSSVRLAGGVTIGAGLCAVVNALQLLTFSTVPTLVTWVGVAALVLGVSCVFAGWGVVRGRFRAAVAALVAAGITALAAVAWVLFALLHGMISLTAFALISLSAISLFLVSLALKDTKKIEGARTRLRAQGLDGGF